MEGNYRVSFPFSNFYISGAHVYSSYLAFTFVAYHEYISKVLNHGTVRSSLMFYSAIFAMLLTGSKTGMLIILIYFFMDCGDKPIWPITFIPLLVKYKAVSAISFPPSILIP